MDKIIDEFCSSRLSTPDLLQQLAQLAWLSDVPEGKELMKTVTAFRVGLEIYQRCTKQSDVDALQGLCIASIAEFVKSHPRASENEIAAKVREEIELFSQRLNML